MADDGLFFRAGNVPRMTLQNESAEESRGGGVLCNASVKVESPRDVLVGAEWCMLAGAVDDKLESCISSEVEANAWLRDEPMDNGMSTLKHLGPLPTRVPSIALPDQEVRNPTIVSNTVMPRSETACSPASAGFLTRMPDLTDDSESASILQELKSIRIRESTILSSIDRLGGGQKGLRSLLKIIVLWLKGRSSRCPSTDSQAQDQLFTAIAQRIEQLWPGGASGVDSNHACQSITSHSGSSPRTILSEGGTFTESSSEELLEYEVPAMNTTRITSEGFRLSELSSQSSITSSLQGSKPAGTISEEALNVPKIRRLPYSVAENPVCELMCYDDVYNPRQKIRRVEGTSHVEVSPYSHSSSPPNPDGLDTSMFCPMPYTSSQYGLRSVCPPLSQTLELPALNPLFPLQMQGPILMDPSNLANFTSCKGSSIVGAHSFHDGYEGESERGRLLGAFGNDISPAISTRMARKQRMARYRQVSSHQQQRSSVHTGGCPVGVGQWPNATAAVHSQSPLRVLPQQQQTISTSEPWGRSLEGLQFLLQKELSSSDVGNLGRIVLPKKEAEIHLPWLAAREGVPMTMEDFHSGQSWPMRYRFWPNNKSRMYLLENTGEFVRVHKLGEGDRMIIYRNLDGNYVIRASKSVPTDLPDQTLSSEETGTTKTTGSCGSTSTVSVKAEPVISSPELSRAETELEVGLSCEHDVFLNGLPDDPMISDPISMQPLERFPSLEVDVLFDEMLGLHEGLLSVSKLKN